MKSFNLKSFILGIVAGIVLTFVGLIGYGVVKAASQGAGNDRIQYLENPVSYENKKTTSFQVFQVFGDAALAREISDADLNMFLGNTVLIKGNNFYTDQVLRVKNPMRIGTFSYVNGANLDMTVPVIDGEIQQ